MSDGGVDGRSGDWAPISVGRVSVLAAILAAILVLCTYITHPIPRFAAKQLGVHEGDFADRGGLAMTWEAPTVDEDQLRPIEDAMRARNPDGYVLRDGRVLKVVLAGVPESDVAAVVARMTTSEGLTFREVVTASEMQQLADLVPREHFEVDQWRPDEGPSEVHTDYYLFAPTREELDTLFASARDKGWQLPAGVHIAYEKTRSYETNREGYRSYVVRDEAALDGSFIARAERNYDPNTNRPIVMLDFNRAGARIFGDVTARIVGNKLAVLVDGEVRSAPIINGAIRGGRASVTMGGRDPIEQEKEADALVQALKFGNLPPGGHVIDARYFAPTKNPTRLWLARALLALLAAFVVGALAFATLRFARPERRAPVQAAAGSPPWSRLAVMLVAPIAMWGVAQVAMFGVNDAELGHIFYRNGGNLDQVSIGALGIMPVLTAYVIVEAFTLILPTWRRRRNAGPEGRQPITLAAAAVTVLLIVFQAWNMAKYMSVVPDVLYPGMLGTALVITSMLAGTLILIIAAELIRWRGLGNGYGALLATGWLFSLWDSVFPMSTKQWVASGDRPMQIVATLASVPELELRTACLRRRYRRAHRPRRAVAAADPEIPVRDGHVAHPLERDDAVAAVARRGALDHLVVCVRQAETIGRRGAAQRARVASCDVAVARRARARLGGFRARDQRGRDADRLRHRALADRRHDHDRDHRRGRARCQRRLPRAPAEARRRVDAARSASSGCDAARARGRRHHRAHERIESALAAVVLRAIRADRSPGAARESRRGARQDRTARRRQPESLIEQRALCRRRVLDGLGGFDQRRVIVDGHVDAIRDGLGRPVCDRRYAEQRVRSIERQRRIEPGVPRVAREHDRHPVVNRRDQLVRWARNDREAVELAGRQLRARPESGEHEDPAIAGMDEHRRLRRCLAFALALPLEEAVGGNEAALALQRIAKHALRLDAFDARVDHQRRFGSACLRGPERDEAPAHHLQRAHTIAKCDDRRVLRRRDVEARLPPDVRRDAWIEVQLTHRLLEILDEAVLSRDRVAAAHGAN